MGAEATATGKSERIEPAARESTWAVVGGGAQLPIALVLAELQSRLYPYERRTQPPAIRMCTHSACEGRRTCGSRVRANLCTPSTDGSQPSADGPEAGPVCGGSTTSFDPQLAVVRATWSESGHQPWPEHTSWTTEGESCAARMAGCTIHRPRIGLGTA